MFRLDYCMYMEEYAWKHWNFVQGVKLMSTYNSVSLCQMIVHATVGSM